MNGERPDDVEPTSPAMDVAKRPYEKPAIIWTNAIDTAAISVGCGKSIPNGVTCTTGSGLS